MFILKLSMKRPRKILTSREEQVLLRLMIGKNNNEIAEDLTISVHTAKVHVCSILQKFGVSRRACVILKALFEGWIEINQD